MESTLSKRIAPLAWRIRIRRLVIALASIWCLLALLAGALFFINQQSELDLAGWPNGLFWFGLVSTLLGILGAWTWPLRTGTLVRTIEAHYPSLDASLLTAAELEAQEDQKMGFLQMDVLRLAVSHSYENRWETIVPGWQLLAFPMIGSIGLLAFFAALVGMMYYAKTPAPDQTISFADAVVEDGVIVIEVDPGNTEVERGSSLLVAAKFPKSVPADATLVYRDADGQEVRLAMNKSLDDPLFGARIPAVSNELKYRVEFGEESSKNYQVRVFSYPELVQADAAIEFPAYTGLQDREIQDVRRVTAVEGSRAELEFTINKPVSSALLTPVGDDADGLSPILLEQDPNDAKKYKARMELVQSRRFRLELIDDEQRVNRVPPSFNINVLKNRPPKLTVIRPSRDIEASPLEEVQLLAQATDDFGVQSIGIQYELAGKESAELTLDAETLKPKTWEASHLLALEILDAEPDDLLSYHFWAEDFDREGNPRRVAGDIFFIEVRPLEQVFRQGADQADQANPPSQQQQQQSQQNAQQAEELAKLQKEVITATWNVSRREKSRSALSKSFDGDVELLSQSQATAKDQLQQMAQQVQDPRSQGLVDKVSQAMDGSIRELDRSRNEQDFAILEEALTQQQLAYAGLLKLRAREVTVSRQNQQNNQGGGGQNNRSQDQLNDLELDEDRNRYEQEKTASSLDETPEAKEDRRVLNRLKDLARRQKDLNEQVKELVTALEAADSREEKEELERRLKSLRDQQEQLLRDTDELVERMQEDQNQQRMSEEADRLQETRENIRKASESLDQREVSQAAAQGARAQQSLENLRDEFKERAAGQFTEQMREMRNRAQEVEKRQEEIAQQMQNGFRESIEKSEEPNQRKSLADGDNEDRMDLDQELRKQQQAVEEIRRAMRETIEDAESVEPLLAESLYDTYRESEMQRPGEALEGTRNSLARGWQRDAVQQQQRAQEGIKGLREGIEKASERVLGDPTEALRNAERTLERLKDDVESELQDATGQRSTSPEGEEDGQQSSSRQGDAEGSSQPGDGDNPAEGEAQPDGQSSKDRDGQQGGQGAADQTPGQRDGERDRQSESDGQQRGASGKGDAEQQQEEAQPRAGEGQGESSSQGQPNQGEGQQTQGNAQGEPSANGRSGRSGDDQRPASRGQGDNQRAARDELINRLGTQPSEDAEGPQNAGASRTLNAGNQRMTRPISGDDFREFYDQLRDVEEMLDDPDLRAEASRIRQEARELRKDQKERHSAEPNWELVKLKVLKPMQSLKNKVTEEVLRRTSREARVPLNRDPVPSQYQDAVKKYYQRLGAGR